MQSQQFFENR